MLGYDSLRKQFKQEQEASENSRQNINPTFEEPSMNTHETREEEKEEVSGIRTMDIMSNLYR